MRRTRRIYPDRDRDFGFHFDAPDPARDPEHERRAGRSPAATFARRDERDCASGAGTQRARAPAYLHRVAERKRSFCGRKRSRKRRRCTGRAARARSQRTPSSSGCRRHLRKMRRAQWIFWPSGTCEPANVSFKGAGWRVGSELLAAHGAAGDRSLCGEIRISSRLRALRSASGPDDFCHRRARARPRGRELPECQRAERRGKPRPAAPRQPDGGNAGHAAVIPMPRRKIKIDTGYGVVRLVQKSAAGRAGEQRTTPW